ncbi:MAG TPA: HEAT repeat domain-containing protein [Gemmatimonadales bacterium]|jgi:hypothetical protein
MSYGRRSAGGALALLAIAVGSAPAQTIERRVAGAPDGDVRLSYAAKTAVCGDGFMIYLGEDAISFQGYSSMNINRGDRRDDVVLDVCGRPTAHTVRMVLSVSSHAVRGVRVYVGGEWHAPTSPMTDLGTVRAAEAAAYLVDVVGKDTPEGTSQAMLGAVIAESASVWPQLLVIARDGNRSTSLRNAALRWLAQAAGDSAARGLNQMIADPNGDRDVRKQAVISLSQLPRDTAIPLLIEVARNNRDPEIRRTAFNALGRSGDPRAIALFEEVLVKK